METNSFSRNRLLLIHPSRFVKQICSAIFSFCFTKFLEIRLSGIGLVTGKVSLELVIRKHQNLCTNTDTDYKLNILGTSNMNIAFLRKRITKSLNRQCGCINDASPQPDQ